MDNRYLDFEETRGLISLINDNHVDNNIKEILVYVNLGSIVNNRPKTSSSLMDMKNIRLHK